MHYIAFTTTVAALLAVRASAQAATGTGTATVINNCGRPVYYKICFNGWDSGTTQLAAGQTYSESYRSASNPAGTSIKLNFDNTRPDYIAQFEYTADRTVTQWNPFPSIFYDISLVNGAPFQAYGLSLQPSDPQCRKSTCPAGQPCPTDQAYSVWNDDLSSKKCGLQADLTLTLCTEAKPPATGPVPDGGVAHLGPVQVRSVAERGPTAAAATAEAVIVERNADAIPEPVSAIVIGHGHATRHAHQRRHRMIRPFSA